MAKRISDLLDLTGQTAIVTGGSMGIGQGIATRLHEAGANVAIADLDAAALKLADQFNQSRPNSAVALRVDVSNTDNVKAMVQAVVQAFGSINILVNNAGIYPPTPIAKMTAEQFGKVIDVNLRGAFNCLQQVSQQMIAQGRGGKIINITSIDALHPSMVGLAHYDASKHGLWGLTKNAALELAESKIWVNAVAPGGIATPGVQKMQGPASSGVDMAKVQADFLAKIPMHRMGEADDIAKVVLFLASEMSSYMTGSQILVDGGALLS